MNEGKSFRDRLISEMEESLNERRQKAKDTEAAWDDELREIIQSVIKDCVDTLQDDEKLYAERMIEVHGTLCHACAYLAGMTVLEFMEYTSDAARMAAMVNMVEQFEQAEGNGHS